ncbi:MATE family efflux transporter [Providencia alcalifaciens]|uniref:MATE family efflux transporter n=1 Tax=Providencia alcalifaciens TaxID=126385 RepID=UPI003D2BB0E5
MLNKIKDPKIKVISNAVITYGKMALLIGISLYTVRELLNNLGIDNYGIFTLSAGLITVFTFLNAAMSISTQRYLSFHQGTNKPDMQNNVFITSLILHFLIGIITISILFSILPILFSGVLEIEPKFIDDAKTLYICMIFTLFFTIISVPFVATLFSRENILFDSIILILQALLKLIAAKLIGFYPDSEKLSTYGFFLVIISGITCCFYVFYCCLCYPECRIKKQTRCKGLLKEMSHFAGWNLYTNLCYVLNTQGLNIILNIFLGTKINAAYGIASQVNGQVRELSLSLLRALNPQIMKSEGMEKRERMVRLSMLASKVGFFLVSIVAIPAILSMPKILELWLNMVPDFTSNICIFLLFASIINQLTVGINSAIQAIGNIKEFQLIIGTVALITLPTSFFLLKAGNSIYSVLILMILIEILTSFIKLFFFSRLCNISIKKYFTECIFRTTLSLLISTTLGYFLVSRIDLNNNWFTPFVIMFIIYPPIFYLIGFGKYEKSSFQKIISNIKSKF